MSGTYRRLEAVEEMELDGETLLLNQDTFAVTKLNGVGGLVWKALADCETIEQLSDRLAAMLEVDTQRIREDLGTFLNEMVEIGLVRFAK